MYAILNQKEYILKQKNANLVQQVVFENKSNFNKIETALPESVVGKVNGSMTQNGGGFLQRVKS